MSERRTIIHYAPTDTWATCGLSLPRLTTTDPARATCKRCIAMMMPYQREARNMATDSRTNRVKGV